MKKKITGRNEARADGTQERNRRKSHSRISNKEQITRCPKGSNKNLITGTE